MNHTVLFPFPAYHSEKCMKGFKVGKTGVVVVMLCNKPPLNELITTTEMDGWETLAVPYSSLHIQIKMDPWLVSFLHQPDLCVFFFLTSRGHFLGESSHPKRPKRNLKRGLLHLKYRLFFKPNRTFTLLAASRKPLKGGPMYSQHAGKLPHPIPPLGRMCQARSSLPSSHPGRSQGCRDKMSCLGRE